MVSDVKWIWNPMRSPFAGQNGRHLADEIFRCILVNEKFRILINISLKFVPKVNSYPALV